MSEQDVNPNRYNELRSICQYHIDIYNALYQLKTENNEDLKSIYKQIKTELIDSKNRHPKSIIKDILMIIPYNNRYTKSYLTLAKFVCDDYHITEVSDIPIVSSFLFYKEYGIKLDKYTDFEKNYLGKLDIHTEDTIYKAIMYNDLEKFIYFIEREGFDKNQRLISSLYPDYYGYSLLELCCYHGAVDCFKLLITKFNFIITGVCLQFSFLGRNKDIMSECLKYKEPYGQCMRYAIISHNIDFVTFLMNEYNLIIELDYCKAFNNVESFLVYFDQTNDINKCFVYSAEFDIPSLCKYFLSHGANINEKYDGSTALHYAALNSSKDTGEVLISHGADINEKDKHGQTALHIALHNNNKEIAELLISHGANINEKDYQERISLHYAAENNNKENAELLISLGANINEKDEYGKTALHCAAEKNNKETAELLISHGANINEKDKNGKTVLHLAPHFGGKEIAELLISHGANINEKNEYGKTALHYAAENNSKETAEVLLSYGANVNEKDNDGKTALHYTPHFDGKEIAELLLSYGANVNEKDNDGKTALHYASHFDGKEIAELLISHGANINEKDNDGQTALHYAAANNSKETAKLLLSYGANVNEKNNDGQTALH